MSAPPLIVGDGAAGIVAAAILPGALVLPSQPPATRVALDAFPFGAGTRLLYPSPGSDEMLRLARWPSPRRRLHVMAYRIGDRDLSLAEVTEEVQLDYGRKMHRAEPPRRAAGFWKAHLERAGGIEVYDVSFEDLCLSLRDLVARDGRLLPYEPLPRDPDPDAPLRLSAGTFSAVIYTCPARAIWRSYDPGPCEMDKVFLAVRPGPAADPEGRGYEVGYRPGPEVSWHREGAAVGRDGTRAVVLEWTLPAGEGAAFCAAAEADARAAGLEPLDRARPFPGVQVRRPAPVPSGRVWRPLGRIAELSPAVVLNEVADAALSLRNAWT